MIRLNRFPNRAAALLEATLLGQGKSGPHVTGGEVSLATAHGVANVRKASGGITYNVRRGSLSGADAYAVAVFPERSLVLEGMAGERQIADFIEANADLLREPQFVLGGWHDRAPGKTYLDVSAVVGSRGTGGTGGLLKTGSLPNPALP
ncbi:MAG: hypothetical protein ABIZ80_21780 [Bryobacteraceae bacterium]